MIGSKGQLPEGPFYCHLSLFVLDFLQAEGPCQMHHLFGTVWASSGLAQKAVPASSLDSWPVGSPPPQPKGSVLL